MMLMDDPVDFLEVRGWEVARNGVLDAGCGVSELHGLFRISIF